MRLAPRIFLIAFLLLLFGLITPGFAVWANAEYNEGVVRKIFRGQMSLAAEKLNAAEDRDEAFARMQERFDFDIQMSDWPASELPAEAEDRLVAGQALIWVLPKDVVVAYYEVEPGTVLRFGPLPRLEFVGLPGLVMLGVLLLVGGFLMFRWIVRPLVRQSNVLVHASNDIAKGNLGVQVPEKRVPDLPELAAAFNKMADRIRGVLLGQRQLLQDVSHELRTPLARIRFGLEMLREDVAENDHAGRLLQQVDETIDQLDRLVGELLEYTRLSDQDRLLGRNEVVDPVALAKIALDRVSLERERGRSIELVEPKGQLPQVRGNPRELGRAIDNLIANALRFAKDRVQLRVEEAEGWVEISVEDDGPGIPVERRERVLEPFVQLERDHAHTGLGLAIVHRIVQGHGGEVRVDDSPRLKGAWIRLCLPRAVGPNPRK